MIFVINGFQGVTFTLAETISKIICRNSEVTENFLPKINSDIDFAIKDNELVMNNFLKKLLDISLKIWRVQTKIPMMKLQKNLAAISIM